MHNHVYITASVIRVVHCIIAVFQGGAVTSDLVTQTLVTTPGGVTLLSHLGAVTSV